MNEKYKGKVVASQGNLVTAKFDGDVRQNEVAFVHSQGQTLKGEVIEIDGNLAKIQVFEITRGILLGEGVEFEGDLLTVELGPGLLKRVFDGLQNPLAELADKAGYFLPRGMYLPPLARETLWDFSPLVRNGDEVEAGDFLGKVPEANIEHKIMVPFGFRGKGIIEEIASKGEFNVDKEIAKIKDESGKIHTVTMIQRWPAKRSLRIGERLLPKEPLCTACRVIDGPFPVAKGGTFCTPGPFGAGKTVLQHQISKYAQIQIVIVCACGERAGEVVEILREFPKLEDPQTGNKLIDRTSIICNTSSMPVAARESSIYMGITIAEYYRQMGYDCLLLADSTSRWAQALREMSGRLEEIPGEEAFPAYLASRIAELYERSGVIRLKNKDTGSVTIGGAVSPAGGNFEEPVTQGTLAVVGCFLGLSRGRSDARRYPAIDPLISWSKYLDRFAEFGDEEMLKHVKRVKYAQKIIKESDEIAKKMAVVGEEGTTVNDMITYLKGELYDAAFLQQNAYDKVDTSTPPERQNLQLKLIDAVLRKKFTFKEHDEARTFFNRLTNEFIQWNYTDMKDPEFLERKQGILDEIGETIEE
ncbi:V-type ATP synthase subunit A [Candidatus Riflebacteria bacterium]